MQGINIHFESFYTSSTSVWCINRLCGFENAAFAKLLLDKKVLIVSVSCYCIQAFCSSFSKRSLKVERYLLCKFLKPAILSCHDELPRLIMSHLRLHPLILVECWSF